MTDFLLIAFAFLVAGVVAVPLATRFGLGSVLGYLIAGIAISPLLAALQVDVASVQGFAEFGVVMMLFLVGLELEPRLLWDMRARLLGLGGLQTALSTGGIMGAAMLLGLEWSIALAIGLVLTLSSTAIVLQTLGEKGLMRSDGGRGSFAVLLFQDIAVIPMLALVPLLAMPELMASYAGPDAPAAAAPAPDDPQMSLVAGLPAWGQALVNIGAIAALLLGGSFATRALFGFIAVARLRELFTAAALTLVIGIALLMSLIGLSPALGTFLAGVVLANSEYRHELQSDIDPFKGLLLGLFFMTVGASIDFGLLFEQFLPILGLTLGLLALKTGLTLAIGRAFGVRGSDGWLMALGLSQAGEFAFVLLSLTVANDVIPPSLADPLLLIVALSMMLTPALFILHDRVIAPRFAAGTKREADTIDAEAPIIIAGHGRFGGIVNRILRATGHETVVLDYSAQQLEMLRAFGFRVFYGDATRPDLLHAAGIETAQLLVIAIDNRPQATELARYVVANHPHVHIIARARDRDHVYELYAAGARDIVRETFDSGVRAGRSALEALGMHPYEAEMQARDFSDHDRAALRRLAQVYDADVPIHRNTAYVELAKEIRGEQEAILRGERGAFRSATDRGWMPPSVADVDAEAEAAAGDPPDRAG